MSIDQILEKHPGPWTHSQVGNQIYVHDALRRQVELFAMLDLALETSKVFTRKPADAATV